MTQMTAFEKILNGELPCNKVYEDEFTLAFHDIHPKAPVHVLVIPKKKLVNLNDATEEDFKLLGRILWTSKKVAEITKISISGYKIIMNNGPDAMQSVFYLHCHVLGGIQMHE